MYNCYFLVITVIPFLVNEILNKTSIMPIRHRSEVISDSHQPIHSIFLRLRINYLTEIIFVSFESNEIILFSDYHVIIVINLFKSLQTEGQNFWKTVNLSFNVCFSQVFTFLTFPLISFIQDLILTIRL